jgi:hypothetical protein
MKKMMMMMKMMMMKMMMMMMMKMMDSAAAEIHSFDPLPPRLPQKSVEVNKQKPTPIHY